MNLHLFLINYGKLSKLSKLVKFAQLIHILRYELKYCVVANDSKLQSLHRQT